MFQSIFNLLYPNICCLCGLALHSSERYFCFACEAELPTTSFWNHQLNPMQRNLSSRCGTEFAAAYLFFAKGNHVQTLLHQLKYKGEKELGILLGQLYGVVLKQAHQSYGWNYLIPVPLHPARQLSRGYNQSELIAEGISMILNVPVLHDVLVRTKSTRSQTTMHREERWDNVSKIFDITKPSLIYDKHILIVDDVFTTGATLEACCQAIRMNNASKISAVTLAYADY